MGRLSKNIFKKMYPVHKALGLFVSVHALLLGLTGVVLVWKDEIESFGSAPVYAQAEIPTKAAFANVEDAVIFKGAGNRSGNRADRKILAIYKADGQPAHWIARLGEKEQVKFRGSEKVPFSADGVELKTTDKGSGLMELILELHRDLLLGTWGKFYIGLIGVFMGIAMISGLSLIPGFNRKKNAFRLSRTGGRLEASERHQFLGLAIWGWLAIVVASGIFLSFNGILIKAHFNGELKKFESVSRVDGTNSKRVRIAEVLDSLQHIEPEYSPHFIAYPNSEFSLKNSFVALLERRGNERDQKLAVVEASSARVLEVKSLPLALEILVLSEPLHFGDYGGVPLKVAWSILGIAFIYFSITGIRIFLFRKKIIDGVTTNTSKHTGKEKNFLFYTLIANAPGFTLALGYFLEGPAGTIFRLLFLCSVAGFAAMYTKQIYTIKTKQI